MEEEKYPKFMVGAFPINDKGEIMLRTSPSVDGKYVCLNRRLRWGETIKEALTNDVLEKTGLTLMRHEFLGLQDGLLKNKEGELNHMIFVDYLVYVNDFNNYKEINGRKYEWHVPADWINKGEEAFGPNILNVIHGILYKLDQA